MQELPARRAHGLRVAPTRWHTTRATPTPTTPRLQTRGALGRASTSLRRHALRLRPGLARRLRFPSRHRPVGRFGGRSRLRRLAVPGRHLPRRRRTRPTPRRHRRRRQPPQASLGPPPKPKSPSPPRRHGPPPCPACPPPQNTPSLAPQAKPGVPKPPTPPHPATLDPATPPTHTSHDAAPSTAKAPTQDSTSGERIGDRMEVDATHVAQRSAQSPAPLPDSLGPNPKVSTTADIRVKKKKVAKQATAGRRRAPTSTTCSSTPRPPPTVTPRLPRTAPRSGARRPLATPFNPGQGWPKPGQSTDPEDVVAGGEG